jgi:putative phosphoesterase
LDARGRPRRIRIGVIADTHGLLRPEAKAFLRGADHILHAGDIGDAGVLDELRSIAELCAVRGNNDTGTWAASLPQALAVEIGEVAIYLIHETAELAVHPAPAGTRVLISGHSHKPLLENRGPTLCMNPGSAGRRRFKLPVAIGEIEIEAAGIEARIIDLASQAVLAHALATVRP